jgi:hypothetical protein
MLLRIQFTYRQNFICKIFLNNGEENASKEYTGIAIKKLIEELKLNNWIFTYIGADHDVEKFAFSNSITNTMTFQKNKVDIKNMFVKERSIRPDCSQKIREKENTSEDFYEKDTPQRKPNFNQ